MQTRDKICDETKCTNDALLNVENARKYRRKMIPIQSKKFMKINKTLNKYKKEGAISGCIARNDTKEIYGLQPIIYVR